VILVFSVPIDLRDVRFKDVHAINIFLTKKMGYFVEGQKKQGTFLCRKSIKQQGCSDAGAFLLLRALRGVALQMLASQLSILYSSERSQSLVNYSRLPITIIICA